MGRTEIDGRALDDLTRITLLTRACAVAESAEHLELVDDIFLRGDNRERGALLRALSFLPGPERFRAVAVEACRTNVLSVFEALACENSYPADHFTDPQFNQMVLKALFMGVAVARIDGLRRRQNDELIRMAKGYASERTAAGRVVPDDIGLIIEKA